MLVRLDLDEMVELEVWAREEGSKPGPHARTLVRAALARHRLRNAIPVMFARCAIHGCKVGLDGDGRLLGPCPGCLEEAMLAIAKIEGGDDDE